MRKKLVGISLLGLLSVGVLSEVVMQPAFARTLNYEKDKKTGHLRLVDKSEDGDDGDGGVAASKVAGDALKLAQKLADGVAIPYHIPGYGATTALLRGTSVNGKDGPTMWMDCSYFVSKVFNESGAKDVTIGWATGNFISASNLDGNTGKTFKVISASEAKPGDIVLWDEGIDSSGKLRGQAGGGGAHVGIIDSKGSGMNAKVIESSAAFDGNGNAMGDGVRRERTVSEIERAGGFQHSVFMRYVGSGN